MYKIIMTVIILCISLFFSGCDTTGGNMNEETFTLSEKQQEKYTDMIEDTLNSLYWYYDDSTLAYFEGRVPDNNEKNSKIYKASEETGYSMKPYGGKEAVIYTADLMHFNSEKAGIVYFYFIKNTIAGLYYTPNVNRNIQCSLKERNVFYENAGFEKAEYSDIKGTFEQKKIKVLSDGFKSFYSDGKMSYQLVCEEERADVYCFNGRSFALKRMLRIPNGLKPISGTFLDNGDIAIIAGIGIDSENSLEDAISERVASRSIIIYSMNGSVNEEIELLGETYSGICSYKNGFIISNDNSLEYFEKTENGWERTKKYYEAIQATDMKIADIDLNGTDELIATDGKDLFIYEIKDDDISLCWRTNISVPSYYGGIYPADLNGDGIKEIYICDSTGTAIRYELKENGLFSNNEDISYGQMIFAADFNLDGKDDYILSDGENTVLYLGK